MAEQGSPYESKGLAIRSQNVLPLGRMHPEEILRITKRHLHEVNVLCFDDGAKPSNACGIQPTDQLNTHWYQNKWKVV